MSIESIAEEVRTLTQEHDSFTNPNDCRNCVIVLKNLLEKKFPEAEFDFLVYPKAKSGDGVHYALLASVDDKELLINPIPAPGFPEFIGNRENSAPTFSLLKKTNQVV